jgi:hypothetical protein
MRSSKHFLRFDAGRRAQRLTRRYPSAGSVRRATAGAQIDEAVGPGDSAQGERLALRQMQVSTVTEFSPPAVIQISPPGWDASSSFDRIKPALSFSLSR